MCHLCTLQGTREQRRAGRRRARDAAPASRADAAVQIPPHTARRHPARRRRRGGAAARRRRLRYNNVCWSGGRHVQDKRETLPTYNRGWPPPPLAASSSSAAFYIPADEELRSGGGLTKTHNMLCNFQRHGKGRATSWLGPCLYHNELVSSAGRTLASAGDSGSPSWVQHLRSA